ncbi:MAG: flagellin, partial [Alphaproteobacteria bacterium]|nr:flagellin [Alphaproteobacteria bacterium]
TATLSQATSRATAITLLDAAIATLDAKAKTLGSNVALLQTRLDFSSKYANELQGGADMLMLADITEECANLVALQTRQQLGISSLSFAGNSEQSVLSLFR